MIRFLFTVIVAVVCCAVGIEAISTPGWLYATMGGALITLSLAIPLHDLLYPEDTTLSNEELRAFERELDEHAQWYGADRL